MSTTIFKYMKKAPENVSHLHFHQILHFFSLLSCNKKILYVTLVINKGVVNRYMFIAPFAFIKKGNLNVGITLKHNKLLFAAPCAAFIAGLIWDKVSSRVAVASIFIGMICGIIAYFMIPDDNINYFVGNVFSLCVPIVVIMIASLFEKEHFDFEQLKAYQPDHLVHASKE